MSGAFKALGHPARRKIVAMLRDGPLTSGEIAAAFEMSWPSVSSHLRALRDAELVECERVGTSVRYRLNISALEEAVGFLLGVMGSVAAASEPEGELAVEGST
jgi:DNA-binding transcriptional ArsR family regulator